MSIKTVPLVTTLALLTLAPPSFAAKPGRGPAATTTGCPTERIGAEAAASAPAAKVRKAPVTAPSDPHDNERELWRHQGVG